MLSPGACGPALGGAPVVRFIVGVDEAVSKSGVGTTGDCGREGRAESIRVNIHIHNAANERARPSDGASARTVEGAVGSQRASRHGEGEKEPYV